MSHLFIAVAGPIGAGKTTAGRHISSRTGLILREEPVKDNPYLDAFYKEGLKFDQLKAEGREKEHKGRVAVMMQMFLLYERFWQVRAISKARLGQNGKARGSVQDRTIYEDLAFEDVLHRTGRITDLDHQTYRGNFEKIMQDFLMPPDVIILLQVTPEEAMRRIRRRGRPCEAGIKLEYLQQLDQAYSELMSVLEVQGITIFRRDWNEYLDPEGPDYGRKIDQLIWDIRDFLTRRDQAKSTTAVAPGTMESLVTAPTVSI